MRIIDHKMRGEVADTTSSYIILSDVNAISIYVYVY